MDLAWRLDGTRDLDFDWYHKHFRFAWISPTAFGFCKVAKDNVDILIKVKNDIKSFPFDCLILKTKTQTK